MSDVGKPHEYDEFRYDNPGGGTNKIERPQGGFMEERIAKLEHDLDMSNVQMDQVKNSLATAEQAINGTMEAQCRACLNPIHPIHGTIAFPICIECIENLGRITKAKKSWLYK